VFGNPQHLRQVIYNLFDNALKFTRAAGRVQVELCAVDQHAVLTVRDTGIGIHAEDLPQVFSRFFQGTNRKSGAHEARGTGLGLSICRAIVRSHEGSIHVDSQLNQGTRFTVKVPLASQGVVLAAALAAPIL
jgi:signal transduction histidine kinase